MTEINDQEQATPVKGNFLKTRRQRLLAAIGLFFLVILLVYFLYWLIWARFEVYTDDAYVSGNSVALMSQITGTVVEINTDDTQYVIQGQSVIKLDPTDNEIALQNAKANLAITVRQVRQLFENADRTLQVLRSSKADLDKVMLDLKRRIGLVADRAVSKEEMEHYRTNLITAKAAYIAAYHSYIAAYSLVENTHLYDHPDVEKAKAALKDAFLNLSRTTIRAPVSGYVAKRNVNVGQQVAPNVQLLAIVPLDQVWVDANYKESQLSGIRVGQPATIYADAYKGITFHGKVVGLNVGTGNAFAILPSQNATGNWIKVVQRLPVRIGLDPKEIQKYPLVIGLSMHVTTDITDQTNYKFPVVPRAAPVYQTNVFVNQLGNVEALINKILQDNSRNMYLPENPYKGSLDAN